MSTSVRVNTLAHSITYLADKMLSSFKRIILDSGLSLSRFTADYAVVERGISTWLRSGHLETIVLEIYHPDTPGVLVSRWDVTVDYAYGSQDDAIFWMDTDAIKSSIYKCGKFPSQCSYRFVVTTKTGRPDVEGWSSAIFLSTDGFYKQSVGTAIRGGGLAADASYWIKK